MARPNRAGRPEDLTSALRSYLRFLAGVGLCRPNLDHAIPPVLQWRLSSMPRILQPPMSSASLHPAITHQRALAGPCNPAPTGSPGAAGRGCGRTQTQRYRMDVRHAALEWQSAPFRSPSTRACLLRHSAAISMLRSGATLEAVGTVLRHRSLDMTAHYAKVDVAMLEQIAQPWPGELVC